MCTCLCVKFGHINLIRLYTKNLWSQSWAKLSLSIPFTSLDSLCKYFLPIQRCYFFNGYSHRTDKRLFCGSYLFCKVLYVLLTIQYYINRLLFENTPRLLCCIFTSSLLAHTQLLPALNLNLTVKT